jgi:hypothetical protein
MKLLAAVFLTATVCMGQQVCSGGGADHKNAPDCIPLAQYQREWQELQQTVREWKHFQRNLDKLREKLEGK